MHLIKKITLVSAAVMTLLSPSFNSDSRSSLFESRVAYADDHYGNQDDVQRIVSDSMSGMTKVSTGQGLSDDEKYALKKIVQDPQKYVTTERSAEYMNLLENVMKNKPNELARELGLDPTTAFTGLQSQLANWKNNSNSSSNKDQGNSLSGAEIGSKNLDDLKRNETYSTLYASIVYSLSKGESADSTSISLAQMMKYPVASGDDSRIEGPQYGSLASPSFASGQQEEGKKLATYVKTLHEYNYLVTKDKTGFSGFWNWLTTGTTAVARGILLNVAWLGAAIYDFAMWGINFFVDAFTKFNVIEIFGLGAAIRGTDSFLNNLLKGMFSALGISGGVVRTVQYLFYVIIVGSFLLMLITQLRKSKAREAVTTLKRNGLKIFTIIMTIPLMFMMYTTTAAVFNSLQLKSNDVQQITSNYVINVTDWAGTMNLSLSPISTGSIAATGEVDERFKPTTANVTKINNAINALKASSESQDKPTAGQSARDQVQALISDKESTAQDYFNFIASRKTSGSGLSAEYLPRVSSTSGSSGSSKTYLLVSRDKKKDVKDVVKKLLGLSDQNDSSGAKESDSVQPSYTYRIANKEDVTIGLESKYDLTPVVWNNPTSYLYGAIPPGNLTSSTLNHANYHLSGYTDMLNDPATGETAKDDALSKALSENAINLALINKFAGVSQSGQMKTLSSQSVAFLLQSKLSNDTLVYKGYNTAANESGAAKNTGAYGITYVENVVPSTGMADYMGKIAGLNAIWVSAGITAMAIFLALLKAPIVGSVIQHFKGFAAALFTGNIISLLEAIMYYIALASSFLFAYLGTMMSLYLVSNLLSSTFLSYLTFVPVVGPIILSILICLLMSWPIVKLRLGVSNKQRRVGLAALLVSIPFILVESLDEYLDRFNFALYGKSKRQTFAAKMARQAEVLNQGDVAKRGIKKGVGAAVGIGKALRGNPLGALQAASALTGNGEDPNAIDKKQKDVGLLGKVATLGAGAVAGHEAGKLGDKLREDGALGKAGLGDKLGEEKTEKREGVDPTLERSSALKDNMDKSNKDGSFKDDNSKESAEKDASIKLDPTKDDAARLDEIADNTSRLLNKDNKVEIDKDGNEIEVKDPKIDEVSIKDQNIETRKPLNAEVTDRKGVDGTTEKVKTHVDFDDVKNDVKEQFENLRAGSAAVTRGAANAARSTVDRVTDSSLGRNVADAVQSAVTGKPMSEIRLEKSPERAERDVQRETIRQEKQVQKEIYRQSRPARVQANYDSNKQYFNSDAISKGLANVQTAVQDLGRNKAAQTTVKVAQQAAKPFAMMADNILFDGEKVIGNALKGIKPSEIEAASASRRQVVSGSSGIDPMERYERRNRDNENIVDAVDELTRELRRQKPGK